MQQVTSYFKKDLKKKKKKKRGHVKLKGQQKINFINEVFDRDNWQCVECKTTQKLTLSHKEHAGMGGGNGPGDTKENCVCRCMSCHDKEERHIDGRVKK